jgi:hypothetical protein
MELGRKQCRIRTPDAEHDKYPRIAQHGRTDVRHDLVGKLMTEAAPRHSLPNLWIQSKGLVWLQLAAVPFMTIVGTVSSSRDLVPSRKWLEFEGGIISALFQRRESALAR